MQKKLLEAAKALKTLMASYEKVLCTLVDKLPEAEKKATEALTLSVSTTLDEVLLMQLPADPAQALEKLSDLVLRMQATLTEVTAANLRLTQKTVELHADLTTNFVKKTESAELIKTAREDGLKAGKAEVLPMVTAMRKESVLLAGLPDAPEDVLGLDADTFKARFDTAKATFGSCGKRGLDAKHATTLRVTWLDKEKVLCQLTELDGLGIKEKEEQQQRQQADPLKGGGGTVTGHVMVM